MNTLWLTTLLTFMGKSDKTTTGKNKLSVLLEDIYHERAFETLIVEEKQKELDDEIDEFLMNSKIPKLFVENERNTTFAGIGNSNVLILLVMTDEEHFEQQLNNLAIQLNNIRHTRIVIYVKQQSEMSTNFTQKLQSLFKLSFRHSMLNVIVTLQGATTLYGYKPFPSLEIVEINKRMGHFFPNMLLNLFGHSIRTYPDQMAPRAMVYVNKQNNELELIGYVGRLLRAFAEYHNGNLKLVLPIKIGEPVFFAELMKLTRNHTIDIAATLASYIHGNMMLGYSYPVEISHFCVMIPTPIVTIDDIFHIVFNWKTHLLLLILHYTFGVLLTLSGYIYWRYITVILNRTQRFSYQICLNDKVLRGIYAQSFAYPQSMLATQKLTFILIFMCGYVVQILYSSYLQTYLTQPPVIRRAETFKDLLSTDIRIITHQGVVDTIPNYKGPEFLKEYGSIFKVLDSYPETVRMRNALNTSYAYGTATSTWAVYEKQQQYFGYRLFYVAPNICILKFDIISLPLQLNSIYEVPLHAFILRIIQSGLFQHWYDSSFQDMLKLKLLPLRDSSRPHGFHAARVEDLQAILKQLVHGLLFCCVVFLGELTIFWLKGKKI